MVVDARTGDFASSIQIPFFDAAGKLIYAAGSDIGIQELSKSLLERTLYLGQGTPFVFDENGKIILFYNNTFAKMS